MRAELPAPGTRQEASWSAIRPGPASAVSALPPAARSSRRWPGPERRRPRQRAALLIAPGVSRSGVPRRTWTCQTWSSVPEPGWSREWRWASWLGQGEFGSGALPAGTRPAPIPPMVKQSVILARVRSVYSLGAAIAVLSSTVLADLHRELQHASTAGHCMGLHRIPTRSVSEGPSFLPQANCLLHPKVTLRVSVLAVDPDRRGRTESWLPDPPNR